MESIFNHLKYQGFIKSYISSQPRKGRGLIQKMADYLNVNQTYISQVLSEKKAFSIEHGYELCEFMGLVGLEKDYFLLMIQKEKTGSQKTQKYFSEQMRAMKEKAQKLSERVHREKNLDQNEAAIFYSSWVYPAVHLFCSLDGGKTLEQVIAEFHMSRKKAGDVLGFLVESGLCLQEGGAYKMGTKSTHLGQDSAFILRHHMNWRNRALLRHENIRPEELVYSAPMSLSQKDFEALREQLVQWIKNMVVTVGESPSEKMAFLNIDFMYVLD